MASVVHQGGLWQVHMGGKDQSEVTVQVHMSAEMAERLARRETDRLKDLNPGRTDLPPESVGSAVLNVLGLYASGSRI